MILKILVCVFMHKQVCVCVCVCVCMYMYVYMYMCVCEWPSLIVLHRAYSVYVCVCVCVFYHLAELLSFNSSRALAVAMSPYRARRFSLPHCRFNDKV